MNSAVRQFVKAAATKVPASRSRLEIEQMLRRYGAIGYGFSANHETGEARVDFIIPESPRKGAGRIPVRIPINHYDVYDRLYGMPTRREAGREVPMQRPYSHNAARVQVAERVAWRNLVLWIDAALSTASIGLRSIAETFAGDRLVTDESGQAVRMQELIDRTGGALPASTRLLLLSGDR